MSFDVKRIDGYVKIVNECYIPCYVANYYRGSSYPIIPAINVLNGGLNDGFLVNWYALASDILGSKIQPFNAEVSNSDFSI